jgi:hypothetical protein
MNVISKYLLHIFDYLTRNILIRARITKPANITAKNINSFLYLSSFMMKKMFAVGSYHKGKHVSN